MARASTGWRPGRAGHRPRAARRSPASAARPFAAVSRSIWVLPRSRAQSDAWRDRRRTIAAMDFGLCLPNFPGRRIHGWHRGRRERRGATRLVDGVDDRPRPRPARRRRRVRPHLRRDPDPRLGRGAAPGHPPRDERDRRAAAQRGGPRQGARDARFVERRPGDRRGRHRLERARVREPGCRRPLPCPRRIPRRDDPLVAPPVVGGDRAIPGSLPHDRGLRVRSVARPVAVADRHRGPRRAGAPASRRPRRRLPLELDRAGGVREAARAHRDRGQRGWTPDARALGARARRVRRPRRLVLRDARHSRRDGGRGTRVRRRSASSISPWHSRRPIPTRSSSGSNASTARSSRSSSWRPA